MSADQRTDYRPLIEAIHDARAFVAYYHWRLSRDQMNAFREKSRRVYVLADEAGIRDALPRMERLARLYDYLGQPQKTQFEGALYLPGDWMPDGTFASVGRRHWENDMEDFLALAAHREAVAQSDAESAAEVRLPKMASAGDLFHHLRQNGLAEVTKAAVNTFLSRYREKHPYCREEYPNRLKGEPQYIYRTADVWPALLAHFGRDRNPLKARKPS